MKQEAVVTELRGDEAVVEVIRSEMCDGCHKNTGGSSECAACGLFSFDKRISAKAKNEAGAEVGDRVYVESPSKKVIGYAALLFLIPILGAVSAYLISLLFTNDEAIVYSAGMAGFIITLVVVSVISDRIVKKNSDITVTEIISRGNKVD